MRGMTEEYIKRFIRAHNIDNEHNWIAGLLLEECYELDPWLPIDENTPKDRYFNLFVPGHRVITGKVDAKVLDVGGYIYPTHYKELPEDPI